MSCSTVTFNVTVTKGSSALVFECESDGTFVTIDHVSHEPKDGHLSESSYTVGVFGGGEFRICDLLYSSLLWLIRALTSYPGTCVF